MIHNNASSNEKSISCCLSRQNLDTYLFRAVLACKRCLTCAYFSPDSDQTTFTLEEALLWIMESYFSQKQQLKVKNVLIMDLLLTITHLFTSHDINWWTGVVWITCGLLWCFYQLFGLSFWRHPFTAEDPLVSKWCNAKFLQICSDEETIFWMAWGWVNVKQI